MTVVFIAVEHQVSELSINKSILSKQLLVGALQETYYKYFGNFIEKQLYLK